MPFKENKLICEEIQEKTQLFDNEEILRRMMRRLRQGLFQGTAHQVDEGSDILHQSRELSRF